MNKPMQPPMTTIKKHFGTQAECARRLGVTRGAVTNWATRGIPLRAVDQIVRISRGRIRHRDLRPDAYPPTARRAAR